MMSGYFNFKQLRPEFPGDEQAISGLVVGDTIEDGPVALEFALVNDSPQIDTAADFSGSRRDANNLVRLPDIGVNFAPNIFEFIQVFDRSSGLIGDAKPANDPE